MSYERLKPDFSLNQQQLDELKRIMPEAFADGKINWQTLEEALSDHLEEEGTDAEHFGLFWPGKREARRMAAIPSAGTLVPCAGEGIDEEDTRNIFIEGENLEVLKLLQKSYAGRIKMIYIDPPYNTGNDFVYEDDFREPLEEYLRRTGQIDEEGKPWTTSTRADGRFHSKWLCMMYPRLKLAKNLLREDGAIFVSIDDNEVQNLRLIMNEILGEENFVASFIWRRRRTQANLARFVAPVHDYIVCFARNISELTFTKLQYGRDFIEKTYANPDNDPRGPWQSKPLARPANSSNREYVLTMPNGRRIKSKWSCSPDTFEKYVREKRLIIPRDGEGMPRVKIFQSELEGCLPNTWLEAVATNEQGSKEIEELFGSNAFFSAPKPVGLIKHLIKIGTSDNDIVLDFFAGSGTTAQAVSDLNAEDKAGRIWILVQFAEPIDADLPAHAKGIETISDLCAERIRRFLRKRNFKKSAPTMDAGFLLFKLSKSNYKIWQDYNGLNISEAESKLDLFETPLVENWQPESLLTEIMLMEGFPLDSKIEKANGRKGSTIYQVSSDFCEHQLKVCLDKKIDEKLLEELHFGENDVFVCLDSALSDQSKMRLADRCKLKTI